MNVHDLMMCYMRGSQKYSDGVTVLLGPYLSDWTQCVRVEVDFSTGALNMEFFGVLYLTHFC
jgi:hypothetical protein